jgi:hypothetical protein
VKQNNNLLRGEKMNEQKQIVTYEQARAHPELRQAYLDTLMPQCPESVETVIYDPKKGHINVYILRLLKEGQITKEEAEDAQKRISLYGNRGSFAVFAPPIFYARKQKHPIFVLNGFETFSLEANFLSCVKYHEGQHTDDLMNGIRLSNGILIDGKIAGTLDKLIRDNLIEFRAYSNQISMGKEEIDSSLMNICKERLLPYHLFFLYMHPKTELEEAVRLTACPDLDFEDLR